MMHPDATAWVAFYLGDAESWPEPEIGSIMTALEARHGRSRAKDMGLAFLALELTALLQSARLTPVSRPILDSEG